jgi:fatty acid kinase fatty acid binding subunit
MPDRRTEVVCDTTCYLPDELIAERNIHRISLYVGVEGELEPEIEISDYTAFYERLRTSNSKVTTSQPSVGDFVAVYEPLLAEGKEIVSLHISGGISGTFEAAEQACATLTDQGKGGERIRVFDSRSGAAGLGFCALAASAAADAGADGDVVRKRAADAREGLNMWFALDTLEYLRRGDRIGKARGWLGSTLRIKPILTFEEEITPVERVRTRPKVLDRREAAETLADDCREIFGSEPLFFCEVGPVLGAHLGPGMLGLGSVPESVLT